MTEVYHLGALRESRAVLSRHARSFQWASWFLPDEARDDAAIVYAFCRLVDDAADEAPNVSIARRDLANLLNELVGKCAPRPIVVAFCDVTERRGMDMGYAFQLIEGVLSDLDEVKVGSDDELLRYAYRVAGTVGLMMCAVLGVKNQRALAHAIDLGVAMQLTNICRDVLEDAERGRVYLPESRLRDHGATSEELLCGTASPDAVSQVVCELLTLAERYYRSADHGMAYIPSRSRFAIVVAARLYRAIGLGLLARTGELDGRAWVSWPAKVGWTLDAARFFAMMSFAPRANVHNAQLHVALQGLPGAAE